MLTLVPLLPFAGFLVNAFFGRRLSRTVSGSLPCAAMLGSFCVSLVAIWRLLTLSPEIRVIDQVVFTWIASGDLNAPFVLRLDPLAAVMILIVTGIGFLIHVYSIGYMHEESSSEYARYFSYLNLFAAFMLVLVLGASLVVMFIGWEGVGLCSYLLIGFWYHKKSATDAGKKAFVVNRIGDFGFVLGILLAFVTFGTLDFREIAGLVAARAPEAAFGTISLIALLLFVGATGKSAQIPLYVWLPDAMEGPTPVSALIHAATMVTAGVYMIGRNAVLFGHAPQVLQIVAVVGVLTALMAGTIGLVQTDIKRVLAYSTVSQLGYMFLAMGVGAFGAGIFHLYTHAFFKALLFLGSGAVIHALAGEQDLRRMGGLRRDLPVTYWTFLTGALAITGVPLLSGFFSKDEILFRVFAGGHVPLWTIGIVTSLLTATYMFRLVFLAFHGERATAHAEPDASRDAPHGGRNAHGASHGLHDGPPSMAVPLILLAVGSVLAGYVGVPHVLGGANRIERFLEPSFSPPHVVATGQVGLEPLAPNTESLELALMFVSTCVALGGTGLAVFFFLKRRDAADRMSDRFAGLHRVLVNKYYVDELYDRVFVQPIRVVSEDALWHRVDAGVVDGTVNGAGAMVRGGSGLLRRLQTGSVQTSAVSFLIGVLLIIGYYLWR